MNLNAMNQFFGHYATCRPSWNPEWTVLMVSPTAGAMTHTFFNLLPVDSGKVEVDWGDGTTADIHSLSHTYTTAGDYIVVIKNCRQFGNNKNNLITEAIQCGTTITSGFYMFNRGEKLVKVHDSYIIPTTMNDANRIFALCTELEALPENFDLSSYTIRSTNYAFLACQKLQGIPQKCYPTNPKCDISNMFQGCKAITTFSPKLILPRDAANSCNGVFFDCNSLSNTNGWSFPNWVISISNFFNRTNLQTIDGLFTQKFTSSNVDISGCFSYCKNMTGTAPAEILWLDKTPGRWGNTADCFYGCTNLSNYNNIPKSWGGPHEEYN